MTEFHLMGGRASKNNNWCVKQTPRFSLNNRGGSGRRVALERCRVKWAEDTIRCGETAEAQAQLWKARACRSQYLNLIRTDWQPTCFLFSFLKASRKGLEFLEKKWPQSSLMERMVWTCHAFLVVWLLLFETGCHFPVQADWELTMQPRLA